MTKVIGVRMDFDDIEWHAPGVVSDYDTLCGVDANDPSIGHYGTVPAPRGQRITCTECRQIFERFSALHLRAADFAEQ